MTNAVLKQTVKKSSPYTKGIALAFRTPIASGMDGQAIGADGSTYLWRLNGMTSLCNGVVVAGLGGIATIESDHAILRFQLAFMGAMSAQ